MKRICLLLLLLLAGIKGSTQQPLAAIEVLSKALEQGDVATAEKLLQQRLQHPSINNKPDSIAAYLWYVGKVQEKKLGPEAAAKAVQEMLGGLKKMNASPAALQNAYHQAALFFESISFNQQAYTTCSEAYKWAVAQRGVAVSALGSLQSNMGTYAYRKGDIALSEHHHRTALSLLQKGKATPSEQWYLSANNMGNIMWYASKTDSALYYFQTALNVVAKLEPTAENRLYRPAVLLNNMAAIYGGQGNISKAIDAMKTTISNLQKFMATPGQHPKMEGAKLFQFEASDNLAGFYKELGNYRQARLLLEHAYAQKQQTLPKNHPDIAKSQVLLGQLYFATKDFGRAEQVLQAALANFALADGDFLFWQADAYNTMALLAEARKQAPDAARYYEKAEALYEQSLQGMYDDIYLDFLRNVALFHAGQGRLQKALATAQKSYAYINKMQGATSLPAFHQLLNLAEVQYTARNFKAAEGHCASALQLINNLAGQAHNLLDSVKIELKKPKLLLLQAKTKYALLQRKNAVELEALLLHLQAALGILDKRKVLLETSEDIGLLMSDHAALLDFSKQLTLELYELTGNMRHADALVGLHESGLYHRIRSRFDQQQSMSFAGLPKEVAHAEKERKAAFASALAGTGPHQQKLQHYLQAEVDWNSFLEMLRQKYPKYYTMRYNTIFQNIEKVQPQLQEGTTAVRYLFVGKELLALVMDRKKRQLVRLPATSVPADIQLLANPATANTAAFNAMHRLYLQLWQPLSSLVRHRRVVIIPDGILHNLNFEMLTPIPISNHAQMATNSLLAKHVFSYQFSLFLLPPGQPEKGLSQRYVAFAPGFSDGIKKQYQAGTDSTDLDLAYMALLPQPFTLQLVNKVKHQLGGKAYIAETSTLQQFRQQAGNHAIIHIGTHAEADDQHPQYSRLIFAKDIYQKEAPNSLYLYDIYNCNLQSELAVLVACETGKPGYQDGEGMISLAHAFLYAGSKSLVTGLWKIDEQASALIIDLFYQQLQKGIPKDEALQLAKLEYLKTAEGRMLLPQYWAGMVIIGNISPVKHPAHRPWLWIVGAIMLAAGAAGYAFYKRTQKSIS